MTRISPRSRRRASRRGAVGVVALAVAALALAATISALAVAATSKQEPSDGTRAERPGASFDIDRVRAAHSAALERDRDRPRAEGRAARDRGAPIEWRHSKAVGLPEAGRLVRGVLLPREGRHWRSWDPIEKRSPSRQWRRWGTDRLVRTTLKVLRDWGDANRGAPRVAVGDLSRPRGGDFGPQYGALGHASHQNGLDVDVYYPRRDGRERPPRTPGQVDVELAQDLVDRFVAAGAEKVFVGPSLPLRGPADVVVPLVNHDNHLHARLPA